MPRPDPSAPPGDVGGVWVPASLSYSIWRALRDEAQRARRNGLEVRPEVTAVLEELRAAAHGHMCESEQDKRTSVHHQDRERLVTTGDLAGRLGVTGFHVRRLAAAAGITRVAHGRWAPEDADRLVQLRRTT